MGHRHLLQRGWGRVAVAALMLLVVAAGLCAFDRDRDGEDEHMMLQDLCLLALLVPSVALLVAGLDPGGRVQGLGQPALVAVPLAVPQPPPRSTCPALFLSV